VGRYRIDTQGGLYAEVAGRIIVALKSGKAIPAIRRTWSGLPLPANTRLHLWGAFFALAGGTGFGVTTGIVRGCGSGEHCCEIKGVPSESLKPCTELNKSAGSLAVQCKPNGTEILPRKS